MALMSTPDELLRNLLRFRDFRLEFEATLESDNILPCSRG